MPGKPSVFVSYVRENRDAVERLVNGLRDTDAIDVSWDREIPPGKRWPDWIRDRIRTDDFFVACFSQEYTQHPETEMNNELTIACERMRKIARDRCWLISVRLSPCDIPKFRTPDME